MIVDIVQTTSGAVSTKWVNSDFVESRQKSTKLIHLPTPHPYHQHNQQQRGRWQRVYGHPTDIARPLGHRLCERYQNSVNRRFLRFPATSFHIGNRWSSEYRAELALALSSRDRGRPSVKAWRRWMFFWFFFLAPRKWTGPSLFLSWKKEYIIYIRHKQPRPVGRSCYPLSHKSLFPYFHQSLFDFLDWEPSTPHPVDIEWCYTSEVHRTGACFCFHKSSDSIN